MIVPKAIDYGTNNVIVISTNANVFYSASEL